jgi:hypothetical protein
MSQGGHRLRYNVRADLVDSTYDADPAKPFLDGEPIYRHRQPQGLLTQPAHRRVRRDEGRQGVQPAHQ